VREWHRLHLHTPEECATRQALCHLRGTCGIEYGGPDALDVLPVAKEVARMYHLLSQRVERQRASAGAWRQP